MNEKYEVFVWILFKLSTWANTLDLSIFVLCYHSFELIVNRSLVYWAHMPHTGPINWSTGVQKMIVYSHRHYGDKKFKWKLYMNACLRMIDMNYVFDCRSNVAFGKQTIRNVCTLRSTKWIYWIQLTSKHINQFCTLSWFNREQYWFYQ